MTSEAACRTGADFIRRRGDHIVEALMDGVPVAQAKEDLGALLGRERGGKTRLALQLGPLDEAKYAGLVDVRVIAFLERAARQHSSDAEGNAHLGLQRVAKRPLGIAAGIARRRTQFFFNPQQLIVFRDSIAARR